MLYLISPDRDLNLRPPAPEANALPLNQLVVKKDVVTITNMLIRSFVLDIVGQCISKSPYSFYLRL